MFLKCSSPVLYSALDVMITLEGNLSLPSFFFLTVIRFCTSVCPNPLYKLPSESHISFFLWFTIVNASNKVMALEGMLALMDQSTLLLWL